MNLREFFYIQKSDRGVFLFILSLLVLAVAFFFFLGGGYNTTRLAVTDTIRVRHDSVQSNGYPYVAPRYYTAADGHRVHLSAFDPNTADSTQLLQLGLQPWQVRNIYKYRAHGGVYRSPSDFARLYGLTQKQYREMKPYIQISDDYAPAALLPEAHQTFAASSHEPYKEYDRDTVKFPIKIRPGEHVNLAAADTTMLKKIPGIGSGWARAIVNYGRRLGGYTNVEQLLEIDGFPEESLPYFSVVNPQTEKLNVNTLTVNQLRRHPYVSFYQARQICDYRRLKGPIKDLSQLALLKEFPPEAIQRLRPYVTY